MKTSITNLALDSLLWVSGVAFAFSFVAHLLKIPHIAFTAGALMAVAVLVLAIVADKIPQQKLHIYTRLSQFVMGMFLGVWL
jgi:multisubunit Na+/H+ antiporter MnhB subunit